MTVKVDDSVFGNKPKGSVGHQGGVSELANSGQGTHSSKNRSAVSGGGKKPFKQKGSGNARAGTIRSPLWKGGGVVFGTSDPQDSAPVTPSRKQQTLETTTLAPSLFSTEGSLTRVVNRLNGECAFSGNGSELPQGMAHVSSGMRLSLITI